MNFVGVKLSKSRLNLKVDIGSVKYLYLDKEEKTQVLQGINRIKQFSGSILVDGINILNDNKYERVLKNYGLVYSDHRLLEGRSIYENLKYYLELRYYSKKEIDRIIDDVLDTFGLKDKKDIRVSKLSKTEMMMVGIARAISTEPRYLVVEDIHKDVDRDVYTKLIAFIKELCKEGMGILYLTSDKEFYNTVQGRR